MSPSESQLRAALHDGEGADVDPDAVISHAIGVRRERRRRINAIAGGVAVVAVIGVGASILSSSSNGRGGGSSADSAAGGASARRNSALPRSVGAAGKGGGAAVAAGCPAAPDHFALPGGGGLGKFGSTDPLFPASVSSIRVCGYPLLASAGTRSIVLSGAEAQSVAASINGSSRKAAERVCPANTNFVGGTLELYAVDGQGHAVDPVVITLECTDNQATNGTGVRYVSSVPSNLLALLRIIPDRVQEPSRPLQGSPVR